VGNATSSSTEAQRRKITNKSSQALSIAHLFAVSMHIKNRHIIAWTAWN